MKRPVKSNIIEILHKLDNSISFRRRLFISFAIVSIPVLLITSICMYRFLYSGIEVETTKTMMNILEKTKYEIEVFVGDTQSLSRNIIYDEDVQKLLTEAKEGEQYPATGDVSYFINSFIVNREYIESLVLIGSEQSLFSTEKAHTNVSDIDNIKRKWWYPYLKADTKPYTWYTNAVSDDMEVSDYNQLMLTRQILSLEDYQTPIGRMMIYIRQDYLQNIWEDIQWGTTANVCLFDENGNILLNHLSDEDYTFLVTRLYNESDKNYSGSKMIKVENQLYVVGIEPMEENDWTIVMAVPFNEVNNGLSAILIQTLVVTGVTFLIIMLSAALTSLALSKPIKKLSDTMDAYGGDAPENPHVLDNDIHDYEMRTDEIGSIYRSYRELVGRVERLIKEVYIKDLEKKDAELALLESQINPHFLYNTLDSINWIAMTNGQDQISEMVTGLSDTFRKSLQKTKSPFITVKDEIDHIKSYLSIQKYRYGDRLKSVIHIDENAKALYMLRFILQPIVENSLKHGIAHIESGGIIALDIFTDEEFLMIMVTNDGNQIDLDMVKELLKFNLNETPYLSFNEKGYGIQNIQRRIKIILGDEYGIKYETLEHCKTRCAVRLPVMEKDRSYE